jgi:short-subunit dehydrogenase
MDTRATALITGASSGIGEALAVELAGKGCSLVLVARRRDTLNSLAARLREQHSVRVDVVAADLGVPGAADVLVAELERRGIVVDVLVNNAGFGDFDAFVDADPAELVTMIHLNIGTLTMLSRLLLPGMLARGHGTVLNVASTAAFLPGPLMAVYYASKAYVLSLSEALAEEVRGSGVTVTVLCPGPVATGFQERAELHRSDLLKGATRVMDAQTVAQAAVAGVERGAVRVIPGATNKASAVLPRLVPRAVVPRLVKRLQDHSD